AVKVETRGARARGALRPLGLRTCGIAGPRSLLTAGLRRADYRLCRSSRPGGELQASFIFFSFLIWRTPHSRTRDRPILGSQIPKKPPPSERPSAAAPYPPRFSPMATCRCGGGTVPQVASG